MLLVLVEWVWWWFLWCGYDVCEVVVLFGVVMGYVVVGGIGVVVVVVVFVLVV